ncbi:hypothetical protein BJV82DRAFT_588509 [Fennellomyces sp. T-0311]|nr:hypothetical protein BJV82DRAFT_588509 [Fennellomyces sp. T-0311]
MNGTLITPELDSLSQWCPKINVYSTAYNFPKLQPRNYSAYINSKIPGLRYIHTGSATHGGVDQVVRQLVKSKDTLEYLAFTILQSFGSNQPRVNDWPDTRGFFQLPKLHTLIHRTQNLSARSFVTILNCGPLLENFELYGSVSLDSRSIRLLGILRSLRYMKFYNGINLRQDLSLLTLLEHFPALEHLIIGVASMPLVRPLHFNSPKQLKQLELSDIRWNLFPGDEDHRTATLQFVKALTCSSKLELLRLTFTVRPGPSLSELVTIPTLNHLEIHFDTTPEIQNLVDFIKALQNTVIETLKLHSLSRLSFAELDALAELQHLATVWLGSSGSQLASMRVLGDRESLPRVSKKGVFQVLKKSPKLATFMLSNDFVMENEHQLEPDSTNLVLRQLASDILDTTSRHWNVPSPDPRHRHGSYEQRTFFTITRIDK